MRDKLPALPAGIAVAGEQLRALALPAAVIHIAGHLWRLRLIRKKRRRKPARAAAASQGKLSCLATHPQRVLKQVANCGLVATRNCIINSAVCDGSCTSV